MGFYQAQKIEKLEARIAELEANYNDAWQMLVNQARTIKEKQERIEQLERELACSIVNGNDARELCLEHAYALSAAGARIAELESDLARLRQAQGVLAQDVKISHLVVSPSGSLPCLAV